MNQSYTKKERAHIEAVKQLACSVCDQPPPSDAHHIKQSNPYLCVALCKDCHTGYNGIHGTKALWKIRKMDEVDALAVTYMRLIGK